MKKIILASILTTFSALSFSYDKVSVIETKVKHTAGDKFYIYAKVMTGSDQTRVGNKYEYEIRDSLMGQNNADRIYALMLTAQSTNKRVIITLCPGQDYNKNIVCYANLSNVTD
jgi:hypothetical protein